MRLSTIKAIVGFTVFVILSLIFLLILTSPVKESKTIPKSSLKYIYNESYYKPESLELVFLKRGYIDYSQNQIEHFKNNGYIAFDLVNSNSNHADVFAPSYMFINDKGIMKDEEREYKVNLERNIGTIGATIRLSWGENGKTMNWLIGHMHDIFVKDGDKVVTGQKLGTQGGCLDSLKYDEKSTGCHAHIEILQGGVPIFYPVPKGVHGDELERIKLYKQFKSNSEEGAIRRIATGEYADRNFDYSKYSKFPNSKIVQVLHSLETGQKTKDCPISHRGAHGCLQFMKDSWMNWGCDGDNDNIVDVENIFDSICGASNYVNHFYWFYRNKHKFTSEENIIWKIFYSWNAGYILRDGQVITSNNNVSPRADNGILGAVNFANNGIEIYKSIN